MTAVRVQQFTSARRGQPLWLRAVNSVGRWLPAGAPPDGDAWWELALAKERGAPDPTPEAREALRQLADSLARDVRFSVIGRVSARDDTLRMARTHLRIQSAFRDSPEILTTRLPPPVFIVGWPRTGTTALHQILASDPDNRTIPYWESFDPVPPVAGPDLRIARLDKMLGQLSRMAPNYDAIHPMEAEMPEECVALFMNDLRSLQYDFQYRAPGYVAWLLAEDARLAYRGYRRQLQLIHHHRSVGKRFVLKDPTHLVHLEALLDVFPDAKVIFTHREPATAISSLCSLHAYTRALFSDDVDPVALGAEVLSGHWARAQDCALELRARLAPGQFTDVRHPDLLRDPVDAVARAYEALDIPLTDAGRTAMTAYVDQEAQRPRNVHEHSPEGFGLRSDQIRERFADYVAAFDL